MNQQETDNVNKEQQDNCFEPECKPNKWYRRDAATFPYPVLATIVFYYGLYMGQMASRLDCFSDRAGILCGG